MYIKISTHELAEILAFSIVARVGHTEEDHQQHFGLIDGLKKVCKDDVIWQDVCKESETLVKARPHETDWL